MIGKSEVMQQLGERIRAAARITGSVLVTGETGSGKELVARSIHQHSGRSTGRFVAVDCGAVPEDLIESELFGFKRGAFTSALADKAGLFEEANGGTLFLDEIANTSRRFQAKLLRALQERQIRRLGDTAFRQLDIRVIAATNRDLRALVARGDFREDLFYRLSVFCHSGSAAEKQTRRHSAARGRHAQRAQADHTRSDWTNSSSTTFPETFVNWKTSSKAPCTPRQAKRIEESPHRSARTARCRATSTSSTWITSGTRSRDLTRIA